MGKIRVEILLKNDCLDYSIFAKFSELELNSFDTIRVRQNKKTKNINYSKEQFNDILANLLKTEDEFVFDANNVKYHFRILKKRHNCFFSITFSPDIFMDIRNKLFSLMNEVFNKDIAIVGYICDGMDNFWQSTEQVANYKDYNKAYEHLKLIQSPIFKHEMIIDIEQNPGHYHIVNDLWFGSCWAMWFGKQYYDYIPETAIASFNEGYENVQLENGARRVILYEDIFSYDNPNSRKVQQKFRDITGMDIVAHDLMKKPPGNIDPTIEILNGSFEHGGTKMMKRYLDSNGEMTKKSKAAKVEVREFVVTDNRWKTVSNEIIDA